MKGKNSFILYTDIKSTVAKLVQQDKENGTNYAGELFLHLLQYVDDENPKPPNFVVELAFEPIKQKLKKDLEEWLAKKGIRAEAGRAGGLARASKSKQKQANVETVKQTQSNQAVNVNVNANVNGNVPLEKETKFNFSKELIKYGIEKNLVDDWLVVRKTKKAANTETALKAIIKEIEKTEMTANDIIQLCIERSWSGFKSEWISNVNKQNNGTDKPTREDIKQGYLQTVLRGNQ